MANNMRMLTIIAGTLFFISACDDGGSSLSLSSKDWECEGTSCTASFVVQNLHHNEANLNYSIRLFSSIDDSGARVEETIVGEASGTLSLQPQEKRTVTEQITVSEEPNGMSAGYSTMN